MQVDGSRGRGLDRGYEYERLPLNPPSDSSAGLCGQFGTGALLVDGRERRCLLVPERAQSELLLEYLGVLSCNLFDVLNPAKPKADAPVLIFLGRQQPKAA